MSGLSVKAPRTRGTGQRVISTIGALAAAVALAGCSSTGPAAGDATAESEGTIGVVVYGNNTYNECWTTGALKALEGSGYEAKLLNSQFDPSKEISNFQSLIADGVDGILTNPTSQESAARGALLASQQNIPTVNGLWFPPRRPGRRLRRPGLAQRRGGDRPDDAVGRRQRRTHRGRPAVRGSR